MDTQELTRALVALPVAATAPPFMPLLRGWLLRSLAAALLAAWALEPVIETWDAWLLVALTVAAALIVGRTDRGGLAPLLRAAACAVVVAAAAALLLDASESVDGLRKMLREGDPVVVASGALVAVFLGGEVIARLLAPYAARVRAARTDEDDDLTHAGLYIGWLERALLYAFVVAGASGAVAFVVAAKSIARYPSFDKGKFGDYFLIGTLASVVVAVGVAVAVRAILGLSPVLA